ncbi:MAG: TetR/AcrR family transcriptional regulator [Candidatus Binataceae bacterium]
MRRNGTHKAIRGRDLERTRRRILSSALTEFAAKGLAGARTEAIARRAGVNKRMLFHCFGNKEELYREILRRTITRGESLDIPVDFGSTLSVWDSICGKDPAWVRLLQWEALEAGNRRVTAENERRESLHKGLDQLRHEQAGLLCGDGVDVAQLKLAMIALAIFPRAFPQITRQLSGCAPEGVQFRRNHRNFLEWLDRRIFNSDSATAGNAATAGSPD